MEQMKHLNRRGLIKGATGVAIATTASAAAADQYPNRPIKIVVPFGAGGSIDPIARAIANSFTQELKQQTIVDNRAGASGWIGAKQVARSEPDGYSLLFTGSALFTISPLLFGDRMGFDPNAELKIIAGVARQSLGLFVGPSMGVTSVKDLVKKSRSIQGGPKVGTSGNGSTLHLAAAMFQREAKIDITLVPYKAQAQLAADLVAGTIDMAFDNLVASMSLVRAGKLKVLMTLTDERVPSLPNVPTAREEGFADLLITNYLCLSAPVRTPKDVTDAISKTLSTVMKEKGIHEMLANLNTQPVDMPLSAFEATLKQERDQLSTFIKDTGLTISEH